MSETNDRRLEKRQSVGGTSTEGLVILRRKGSIDPSTDDRTSELPLSASHWISKVDSVSCDVMSGDPIRMMGYMEKRSKLLGWKKFWFVLDGHLLTYFKSKADYESLSPFVGSITLGNVSTVRPIQIKHCRGYPMQIISRNQVYSLRCSEKDVLEEWVLALQETISVPPSISSPVWADPGAQFYRYSFASVSEWSIADSQGDISGSLNNFPKNFYLKRDKFDLKQKCQSFTHLPTDSTFPPPDSPNSSTRSNQSIMISRQDPKMRYSASLLQLESSAQATELKRELASKLSIGQNTPSTIRNGGGGGKDDVDVDLRKFSGTHNLKMNFSSASGDLSVKEVIPGGGGLHKLDPEPSGPPATTSFLAAIAEGFEPGLKRRPHTLQLPAHDNDSLKSSKKKRGIGTLLQRIFKKEFDQSRKNEREMVISGPVDLRAPQGKKGHLPQRPMTLSHSPATPTSDPFVIPPVTIKSKSFLNELKTVQRRRSSNSSDDGINSTMSLDLADTPPPLPRKSSNSRESLTYNQKLDKFNRLSAQLSTSPPNPSGISINRSSSCRVTSISDEDEPPPLLPPKKNSLGRSPPSAYDTPKNNRPVTGTPQDDLPVTFIPELVEPRQRKISLKELLAKKNSAPEITFGEDQPTAEFQFQPCQHFDVFNEEQKIENVTDDKLPVEIDVVDTSSNVAEESEPVYYSTVPLGKVEAIYEEIKYATQEISVIELETVQEYCDEEEDEFYDEFVTPMPPYVTRHLDDRPDHDYNVRCSGMTALQEYLNQEASSNVTVDLFRNDSGEAAVNRLGRSVAVHKLEKLLQ